MSLRNKLVSSITLAAGIVVFSTGAFAQDTKPATTPAAPQKADKPFKRGDHANRHFGREAFRGHRGAGRMGGGMAMMRGLDLTDAQKAQIRSIREANRPDKAKFDQLKAIRESRKNGTPITDDQKQQLKAFREQTATKAKAVHEQILAVLTADQKAQIEKRRDEMKTRREEMRKRFEERRQNRTTKPVTTDKPKVS